MSPAAAANLFVKDEIAQPAHDGSLEGVDMRGAKLALLMADSDIVGRGMAESGRVWLCLRILIR